MRRDDDLIRKLLLAIEETDEPPDSIKIEGYEELIVNRHLELLEEAGYIEATPLRSAMPPYLMAVHVERLTWDGHDFLEAARNETVWKKARERIKSFGGGVSFAVLKTILIEVAKEELGLGGAGS